MTYSAVGVAVRRPACHIAGRSCTSADSALDKNPAASSALLFPGWGIHWALEVVPRMLGLVRGGTCAFEDPAWDAQPCSFLVTNCGPSLELQIAAPASVGMERRPNTA